MAKQFKQLCTNTSKQFNNNLTFIKSISSRIHICTTTQSRFRLRSNLQLYSHALTSITSLLHCPLVQYKNQKFKCHSRQFRKYRYYTLTTLLNGDKKPLAHDRNGTASNGSVFVYIAFLRLCTYCG